MPRLKTNLPLIQDMITQCLKMDAQKNKLMDEMRHSFEKTTNFVTKHLNQIPEHIETLKVNQENQGAIDQPQFIAREGFHHLESNTKNSKGFSSPIKLKNSRMNNTVNDR